MTTLSGFCGITNPPDSHARCTKAGCPCIHHVMAAPEPEQVDPVTQVAAAVAALEDALEGLLEQCTDPQALDMAALLYDVQAARIRLHNVERDVEAATARALMQDEVQAGGWRIERRRSPSRKAWDHDTWRRDVRAKVLRKHGALKAAAVVTADGEALDVNLYDLLADVQDVHGSSAPKVGGLRGLGLDPADYCETTPGTVHVAVQRVADTKDGETDAA